jgi:hypothetical protein
MVNGYGSLLDLMNSLPFRVGSQKSGLEILIDQFGQWQRNEFMLVLIFGIIWERRKPKLIGGLSFGSPMQPQNKRSYCG